MLSLSVSYCKQMGGGLGLDSIYTETQAKEAWCSNRKDRILLMGHDRQTTETTRSAAGFSISV